MNAPLPRRTLRTAADLVDAGLASADEAAGLSRVLAEFSLAITPAVADAIRHADPSGGIARQFVPSQAELDLAPEELADPIGDEAHSPVKGIVHRYADRVLLKPLHACAVYCRFCFRREQVGEGGDALSAAELDAALAYIAATPAIWEVILSGGDPLILSPRRLGALRDRLEAIPHVRVVRVHTRVPVVAPERVTAELVASLKRRKPTYIAVHANHPDELTPPALAALERLADAGLPLLGQSVLLRGVNDDPATLERLLRGLVEARVKPYYLHQGDLARGTAHFRVGIEDARALAASLRGRMSGLCQPALTLDIPGGHGKVPLNADHLRRDEAGRLEVRDPAGCWHPHPG